MIAKDNILSLNKRFHNTNAESIITFALKNAERPIVTTSFGAHSAAVLYAATRIKNDIKVGVSRGIIGSESNIFVGSNTIYFFNEIMQIPVL